MYLQEKALMGPCITLKDFKIDLLYKAIFKLDSKTNKYSKLTDFENLQSFRSFYIKFDQKGQNESPFEWKKIYYEMV